MHYPTREKIRRNKILHTERHKNLCKLYNKCNDWNSFRVKTDLINISKLELLKFWLYYTYMNRSLFPFIIVLSCIASSIGIVLLLTTGIFIAVVSTLIAIFVSVAIVAFLECKFFPDMYDDIENSL